MAKIDENVIQALTGGTWNDPFSVLGAHKLRGKSKGVAVRAFIPDAKKIVIRYGRGHSREMDKHGNAGFFEAIFERRTKTFAYTFDIENFNGQSYQAEDPYRFGPLISEFDLQIWGEGNHIRAYELMGAHIREIDGVSGVHFVVSAPAAARVSVVGDFNNWDGRRHVMRHYHMQGIWDIFIPGLAAGDLYKFEITNPGLEKPLVRADPYAFQVERRPKTASIVYDPGSFKWKDDAWIEQRQSRQSLQSPISIYEVHLGSWKRNWDGSNEGFLTYREAASELIPYIKEQGFTHVEVMPLAEHPFDPSWGYQITGYFAPTCRYGEPEDLMYLINECHKNEIGVILDWVPGHFVKDEHGLYRFDGSALYEHPDPRIGEHKDWGTAIFDYGRPEVKNFLISNSLYWMDKFHIDGLRVDAVASMLYLDYSRAEGEWVPNKYGGRENLEAIEFLKQFNVVTHREYPGTVTVAEESTAWPMVSRPTYMGGLGFDYKWNMGWMNDILRYMKTDPIFRKHHQNELTFSFMYAFTENFILPFSHDEVVHLKRSMLDKMPGDEWQKFANLRLLYTYMYMHPGKKLLFMGDEFGQWSEWDHSDQIEWELLKFEPHRGVQYLVRKLNEMYSRQAPLHQVEYDWDGFEWIDFSDADHCIISFIRYARDRSDFLVCVFNFTPMVYHHYRVGVPQPGKYRELLNSDNRDFGGSDVRNDKVDAEEEWWQNHPAVVTLKIPPLGAVILKPE